MIDLAQIEAKVLARINAISAEELQRRLCERGYDIDVIERQSGTHSFFAFEYDGQYESASSVIYLTQSCGSVITISQACNSSELALAA